MTKLSPWSCHILGNEVLIDWPWCWAQYWSVFPQDHPVARLAQLRALFWRIAMRPGMCRVHAVLCQVARSMVDAIWLSGVCSPLPLPSFYVRPSRDALCFKMSKMWTGGCQTSSNNSCLEILYWRWQELSFTISPQNQCQSELSNRIRMLDKEICFKVQTSSPKMQASAYTPDKLHKWPRLYLDFTFTEFSSAFYKCSKASISISYK